MKSGAHHIAQKVQMKGVPDNIDITVENLLQKDGIMDMKKMISLLLVVAMCLSTAACGGNNKKAFEISKAAYENIDIAYEITEQFGSDIYEAWRLAIYDDEEIIDNGADYLASELSLSADEIRTGAVYTVYEDEWYTMSDEEKDELIAESDLYYCFFEDDLFEFCVETVVNAYVVNGKVEEAQTALDTAKAQMKELSAEYSDYEHYPNLKGYFTTASSFFDFCQNPTGSFEQLKETINKYNNEARDYISDLDYIFED